MTHFYLMQNLSDRDFLLEFFRLVLLDEGGKIEPRYVCALFRHEIFDSALLYPAHFRNTYKSLQRHHPAP